MIDPGLILSLIADLQGQVLGLKQRIAELEAAAQQPAPVHRPMVVPKEA